MPHGSYGPANGWSQDIDVIDLYRENNITLFCLPPDTTHALQPLDVAVFKSLKDSFAKAVRAISFTKKNFTVTKREFARVHGEASSGSCLSIPNVKSGFSKCGIYPNAVAKKKMLPSEVHQSMSSLSDSAPESSVTESSRPPSLIVSSSESPSRPSSPGPTETTGDNQDTASATVVATPISGAVVTSSSDIASTTAVVTPISGSVVTSSVCSLSTPVTSVVTSPSTPFSPVNPLVAAGLIPEDLSDIHVYIYPPQMMQLLRNQGQSARHLTSDEYFQMLKNEEKKKMDAEELKEKKKAEREQKKKERLEQQAARKKEIEERKKKREAEKQRKHAASANVPRARRRLRLDSDSGDDASESEHEQEESNSESQEQESESDDSQPPPGNESNAGPSEPSHPRRRGVLPARFRDDEEDEDEDGVLCDLCGLNEPPGMTGSTVFWVDCDSCDVWVHNYCAFNKKNAVSRRYKCKKCCSS